MSAPASPLVANMLGNVRVDYETETSIGSYFWDEVSRVALFNKIFDIMGMVGFQVLTVTINDSRAGYQIFGDDHGR